MAALHGRLAQTPAPWPGADFVARCSAASSGLAVVGRDATMLLHDIGDGVTGLAGSLSHRDQVKVVQNT